MAAASGAIQDTLKLSTPCVTVSPVGGPGYSSTLVTGMSTVMLSDPPQPSLTVTVTE